MTSPAYIDPALLEPKRPHPFDAISDFLNDRKKKLEDWDAHPPHSLGICLLLVIVLELVLAHRLAHRQGPDPMIVRQFFSTAGNILIAEGLLIFAAHRFAGLFGKVGKPSNAFTFFNFSLTPLLLILPMALLIRAAGFPDAFRAFFLLLLALKVLANWKDVIEKTYLLTRLQSTLILVFLGMALWILIPIVMLMGFAEALKDVLENLK
ncbi:MAG: hypothetical protein LHV69_01795 [Elusimicrobia bacterium]|nr:hypothetical protein [Candidatus Obscuribacterium magneticum]